MLRVEVADVVLLEFRAAVEQITVEVDGLHTGGVVISAMASIAVMW